MGKLTVAAIIAFLFLLAGLGLHVAGFVTKYWMTADRAEKSSGTRTMIFFTVHIRAAFNKAIPSRGFSQTVLHLLNGYFIFDLKLEKRRHAR